MTIKEVAVLLGWKKESVRDAIETGINLAGEEVLRLESDGPDCVSDVQLDRFLEARESQEPGRHPPVHVRRLLRVEAHHRCAICRGDAPLQFHHIVEWQELKHHDPHHMIAICGTCHDKINTGQIERKEQRAYKIKLQDDAERVIAPSDARLLPHGAASPLSWHELRDTISAVHSTVVQEDEATADSQFDLTIADLDKKNKLNLLGADSFAVMREHDEPFFGRIHTFLENPRNSAVTVKYHEVVDEIRRHFAAEQIHIERFEDALNRLYDVVNEHFGEELAGKRRTLRILLSFMYFNCDIGRKA